MIESKISGRFRAHVIDRTGAVVSSTPWQKNLILDSGIDLLFSHTFKDCLTYCVAGTGSTPTRDVPDGDTFSQSGTTVTRDTGTDRDFISGDVGKVLRFSTGEEAYVTAFINADNVTVNASRTVAATTIVLYRVAQTGLAAEVKRTNTIPSYLWDDGDSSFGYRVNQVDAAVASASDWATGIGTIRRSFDFASEAAGSVNYTEIGLSYTATPGNNLFNRIVLAGTVTVADTQLLRVEVEVTMAQANCVSPPTIETEIPGWPRPYDIVSAAASGSALTITVDEAHHYLAGGNIRLSGITRPRIAISAASSNATTMTITAVGHGLAPADDIIVEEVTPTGYNGKWTVATAPNADTLTITSAADPGTGTVFGNVREQEPEGTAVTVAVSDASSITITAAGNGYTAGDLVVIKGCTPAGYNGVWVVDSVDGDDFTILTSADPGAGTVFGDTYAAAAETWFDGSYTMASVTSTTVVVTSSATHADGESGRARNNVRRKVVPLQMPFTAVGYLTEPMLNVTQDDDNNLTTNTEQPNLTDYWTTASTYGVWAGIPTVPVPIMPLGFPRSWRGIGTPKSFKFDGTTDSGVEGYGGSTGAVTYAVRFNAGKSTTSGSKEERAVCTFAAGVANLQNIKYIVLGAGYLTSGISSSSSVGQSGQAYILFEEPQRKDSTHALSVEIIKSWTRDFAASA